MKDVFRRILGQATGLGGPERGRALPGPWAQGPPRPAAGPARVASATGSALDGAGGGRFLARTFSHVEGDRDFMLFLPDTRDQGVPEAGRPLLVMLHGCGQHPEDFAAGTRMNRLAGERGWCLLYPAQSLAANAAGCWNWFEPRHQGRGQGEPAIIEAMTRAVMAEHAIDPNRVYAAGLSAGGAMAATLGVIMPDLFAAVGIHSGVPHGVAHDLISGLALMRQGTSAGQVHAAPGGARRVPVIIFHGDRDFQVNSVNSGHLIAQFCGASLAAGSSPQIEQGAVPGGARFSRTRYLDPSGATCAELWMVAGGGHAWFGGSPRGSFTEPAGPDASRAMLDFFLAHPLRGPATPGAPA